MVVNYKALQNVSKLEINVSRLGKGTEIPENLKNYTRDVVGDIWINSVTLCLFIMLVAFYNIRRQYPISQAVFISSVWTFVVAFGFTITGFTKNIYPLFFYGVLVLISWIWVYTNKRKGLEG